MKISTRVNSAGLKSISLSFMALMGVTGTILSSVPAAAANSHPSAGRRAPASTAPAVAAKDKLAEALLKTYRDAVVKITVSLNGVPVSTGAGFFISNEGLLVTNYHIVKSAMSSVLVSTEIKMADGSVVRGFEVAGCSDARNLDLCVLKIAHKPTKFFKLRSLPGSVGDAVYMIGHTNRGDFSIDKGVVSNTRLSSGGVNEVQVSVPMNASGAPIFTSGGEIIGLATKFVVVGRFNVGISNSEIQNYSASHTQLYSPNVAYRQIQEAVQKMAVQNKTKLVDPALRAATHGQSLANIKGFHEAILDFGNEKFRIFLPDVFEHCERQANSGVTRSVKGLMTFACASKNDSAIFNVQRMFTGRPGLLATINGKRLMDPKPIIAAELLMDVNKWKTAEKRLNSQQRAFFYSQPSLANCQRLGANAMPHAFFSSALACRFTVKADAEPEGFTSSIWVEHGKFVYGFNLWMPDRSYESYFDNIASVAALSAQDLKLKQPPKSPAAKSKSALRTNGSADRKVASTDAATPERYYKMNLPEGVQFLSSRRRADNTQYDTYGLSGAGRIGAKDYILIVDRMNVVFRPSDYDRSIHELVGTMMKSLNVRLKTGSLQVVDTSLDGMPGRLVSATGNGAGSGRENLVLMLLGFGPNDTHLITQISDSSNPNRSFSEFRNMVASFKRK